MLIFLYAQHQVWPPVLPLSPAQRFFCSWCRGELTLSAFFESCVVKVPCGCDSHVHNEYTDLLNEVCSEGAPRKITPKQRLFILVMNFVMCWRTLVLKIVINSFQMFSFWHPFKLSREAVVLEKANLCGFICSQPCKLATLICELKTALKMAFNSMR